MPSFERGFPQRLENLENENNKLSLKSYGTLKIGTKSWNFVIKNGILPLLLPNFTKFMLFLPTIRNQVSI